MTLLQAFRYSNYALIFLGIFSLVVCEFLHPVALILTVLAFVLAENRSTIIFVKSIPTSLLNTITLLAFGYFTIYEFLIREDLVAAVIYFTIFLQLVKIFTARKLRDFFQIYILALTHLIASTMLTVDMLFIIPFLMFIVMAPWAFTLFNLKSELEKAYLGEFRDEPEKAPEGAQKRTRYALRSRDIATPRFFFATAFLSLVLLANAMAIFFIFPRVSFGFLFRKIQPNKSVSGFSENVDLNSFGNIKLSDSVVMRVETSDRVNPNDVYWRGLGYDDYKNNRWVRNLNDKTKLRLRGDEDKPDLVFNEATPQTPFRYKVFLEPLETKVLFTAETISTLSWDKMGLERILRRVRQRQEESLTVTYDRYRSLYFSSEMASDRIYEGVSDISGPNFVDLQNDNGAVPAGIKRNYLGIPAMSNRFYDKVSSLTSEAATPFKKAQAIIEDLLSNYGYTLNVSAQGDNSVEGFLFDTREGHCEYFATAAALMIRAAGVPSRLVSGFRGGEWNQYGNYITVRQRHAHTWIEVYFADNGWVRFDPTPPDTRARDFREIRFAAIRKLLENVELRWYKYIINYDLHTQLGAVKGIWERSMSTFKSLKEDRKDESLFKSLLKSLTERGNQEQTGIGRKLIALLALVIVLMLTLTVGKAVFRRVQEHRRLRPELEFFRNYLKLMRKKGYFLNRSQTLQEFAVYIANEHPEFSDDNVFIVECYERVRFGNKRLTQEEQTRIREIMTRLGNLEQMKKAA